MLAEKMRTMQHNSRTNSKGRVHGTKHNDREFDTERADNIDQEKSKENIYWHLYQNEHPEMTFTDAELKFYEDTFGEQLQKTNENYIRHSHPERCKDMVTWKMARQNAPEETVTQIGKMEGHVDATTLMECYSDFNDRMEKWNSDHGRPFTTLSRALHVDEAVPHIQSRRVWHYTDDDGMVKIGQEKALAKAGVQLPHPDKKEGRNNHRKITFDKMAREMWFDVLREHGLEIEEEALPNGKHNREKEDMIRDKYQAMLDETTHLKQQVAALEAEIQPLRDLKTELDDVGSTGKALMTGHVAIKKKDFETMQQQAKAYVANRDEIETLRKRSAQLDQREQLLDDKEKKLNRALADTKSEKEKFQIAYDEQRHLNEIAEKLYKKNLTLVDEKKALINENTSLKAKNDEQEAEVEVRVQKAVEAAVKPLQDEIKSLNDDLSIVSSALSHLMQLMRYVVAMFAGKISRAFLNAGIKRGEQEMERAHFTNIPQSARVRPEISKDIVLDLRYKKGDEGKGLYDYDDRLIYRAESITEAKEMFPKCNIKNEIERDRGYGD